VNLTDYLKKLRKREVLLGEYIGTICPYVEMKTSTGKNRKTLSANTEQILHTLAELSTKEYAKLP